MNFHFRDLTKKNVKFVLIITAILIVLAVMITTGFAKIESLWFIFPLFDIRISTLATAIICFAIVLFLQRRNTLKSVYYAILAFIVPMGLFEIVWYYSAALPNHYDLRIFQFVSLFGWVLLGFREVYRTRPPRSSIFLYAFFVVLFAIWLASGFKFNYPGNPSFSLSAEVINVVSKGALFFAFAFHIGFVNRARL